MDESRFGLLSIQRRCLTIRGVKPITPYQHRFNNFYLFGAYSPINGNHFTLEMPYCNSHCFQIYLNQLAKQQADEFKIILLDNGAFHKAKELKTPPNLYLLFLPPYCPELNPSEKMWRYIKDRLANKIFHSLESLSDKLEQIIKSINHHIVKSITGWELYKKCIL